MRILQFLTLLFMLTSVTAFAQNEVDGLRPSGFHTSTATHEVGTLEPMPLKSGANPEAGFIPVKLRLMDDLSSSSAKAGERVTMEAVEAVYDKDRLVVEAGARADAVISKARRRGHNRRDGELAVTVRSIMAIDGQQRPVRLATLQTLGNTSQPIFGPCTFPIPADPVGLFRRGKDTTIRKGYEITVALPSASASPDVR